MHELAHHVGAKPRQQGGRPTCSVFTLACALEFASASQHGVGERFSVEYLNWAANQVTGRPKDGGFFSELWNGFAAYGICAEAEMPYRAALDSTRPPNAEVLAGAKERLGRGLRLHWIKEWNVQTGLTDAELLAVKRSLSEGWPVCGGFRWPKVHDGVMRLSAAQLQALLEGLDWRRVHEPRRTVAPAAAG